MENTNYLISDNYTKYLIKNAINTGMSYGSCYARAFEEMKILYEAGEFSSISSRIHNDIYITLSKGTKTYRTYLKDVSNIEDYENVINQCLESNIDIEEHPFNDENIKYKQIRDDIEFNIDLLISRIEELIATIKYDYPDIVIKSIKSDYIKGICQYSDSFDHNSIEKFGKYKVNVTFYNTNNSSISDLKSYVISTQKLDKQFINMGALEPIIQQYSDVNNKLNYNFESKCNIVFMPDILEKILRMVVKIYASDHALLQGQSLWSNKLDRKVVSTDFNLSLNYKEKGIISAGNRLSHYGYINTNLKLIEGGTLCNYLISKDGEKKLGMKCSYNDGGHFTVKGGEECLNDILKTVGRVLVISKLNVITINPLGDTLFEVNNCIGYDWGIKCSSYNKLFLKFNLNEMFNQISAISKEVICSGSSILPYIIFQDIEVING